MDFLWRYFDRKKAAVAALQDFPLMEQIIDNPPEGSELLVGGWSGRGPDRVGGRCVGVVGDPTGDRATRSADQARFMQERYREAKSYMGWFLPAWEALSDTDRSILEAFYLSDQSTEDTLEAASRALGLSRAGVYSARSRAVSRLARALYA